MDLELVLDEIKKIDFINKIKQELHKCLPFNSEPVDCVLCVKAQSVVANNYNPNAVAPTEMKLKEKTSQQNAESIT
jgi:hypothetical protein